MEGTEVSGAPRRDRAHTCSVPSVPAWRSISLPGSRRQRPSIAAGDDAGHGLGHAAEGRVPARVLAGAACDDDADVVRLRSDARHAGTLSLRQAGAVPERLDVFGAELLQRVDGVLENELADRLLGVAVGGDGGGVLGAEREHRVSEAEDIVRAGLAHRPDDRPEDALAGVAVVFLDVVRRLAAEHGDGAQVRVETQL